MMKPIRLTHRAGNTEVFSLVVIGSDEGEIAFTKQLSSETPIVGISSVCLKFTIRDMFVLQLK